MRKLSTLEHTVLGLTWLRGPCTTYAIMKELESSASSYHKSRAGAVYAAMKRLLGFGYIASAEGDVSVTPLGEAALKQWLVPPIPMVDIAHSADLVRLRMFFLGVIEQDQRLAFVDHSLAGLRSFLAECEGLLAKNEEIGDYFGVLATASTILETRARIEWLTLVRRFVEHPAEQGDWAAAVKRELDSLA